MEHIAPPLVYDKPHSTVGSLVPTEPPGPTDPPLPTGASSSPDQAIIAPTLFPPDDLGLYQDLLRHMAMALYLSAEDVKDSQDEFLDILQPT